MSALSWIARRARAISRRVRSTAPFTVSPAPPTAATIDLGSPSVAIDPFPHYERLRRAGSVQFLARHGAWIVFGYEDLHYAFSHAELFANSPYAEVDRVLLGADPPAHTAARRIVSRYFSGEALERLGALAQEEARSLLKPRMDVVREYGVPISERVAMAILGLDREAVEAIHEAHAAAPELAAFTRALDQLAERATLHGRLIADGFADAEARSLVRLLWLATTTTTQRVIAYGVLQLLLHGDVRQALERDPALVTRLVEEVLRLHPPEYLLPRRTTSVVELGGIAIPEGALVHLCVAAANRDPAVFGDPSDLRLDRPPTRHFTFGSGIHACIGAALGRQVVAIAVTNLLVRAPLFRALEPLDALRYRSTMTTNEIERLLLDTGTGPS